VKLGGVDNIQEAKKCAAEKLQFSRGWKWVGFDMEAAF
jgi:hypothetical protein